MENLTIIYYTSNREDEVFEKKVRENLLKNSQGLPIISVSQKPISLGKNICVGDHGNSYINEYRQILTALKEVKTPYAISAEADFLYAPDYFNFKPDGENVYRSDNVWIVFSDGGYRKKPYSEGAQICKVDYMIEFIENYLKDLPEWFDGRPDRSDSFYRNYMRHQKILWRQPFKFFHSGPCLSFKTGNGVRKSTNVEGVGINDLEIWGNINNLRKKYL